MRVFDLANLDYSWSQQEKDDFLRAYVDLVGQLSACNNSLLWWATDISSKNRFLSLLNDPLEKLFKILRLIKRSEEELLVFIGVPGSLQKSLRSILNTQGINLVWQGDRFSIYGVRVKAFFMKLARVIKHLIYIVPRIILARRLFGSMLAKSRMDKPPAYVIKTFIASRSFDPAGVYKDLFFGPLVDFMTKRKRVIVLADVMDDFKQTIGLIKRFGGEKIYPLECFLSLRDIGRSSWQALTYVMRCPRYLEFDGYDVAELVNHISCCGGDKIQILHLFHYYVMVNFLKHCKVREFVLTCEFNPWEKMCLWAIKQIAPEIKTFGYQHTVVPQASVNMFTSKLEQDIIPKPDVVLTVGKIPKDIIHRYETCKTSAVEVSCGLRFGYLFGHAPSSRRKMGHILLALEGLPQVVQMTNYVLNQWDSRNGWQLRIRTHPVLPLDHFAGQLNKDPRQMPGVEVSQETSLQEDLLWADMVIYWGSTVALEAVSMGKPVIHYDTGSLLSYDPLFELAYFKWVVGHGMPLKSIIDQIYSLSESEYEKQRQAAADYIAAYFYPVSQQSFNYFMESV